MTLGMTLAVKDLGWIYAEDPMDASRAGWLPSLALEDEQDGHAWILVQKTMPAVHESQLNVEEGGAARILLFQGVCWKKHMILSGYHKHHSTLALYLTAFPFR